MGVLSTKGCLLSRDAYQQGDAYYQGMLINEGMLINQRLRHATEQSLYTSIVETLPDISMVSLLAIRILFLHQSIVRAPPVTRQSTVPLVSTTNSCGEGAEITRGATVNRREMRFVMQ